MTAKLAPLHSTNKQQGFVLVLTLWVLVIVAIAAGYFAERVARAIELAQQSQQNTIAAILFISPTDVSIKATTTEKMGFIGREEGLAAYATILLENI